MYLQRRFYSFYFRMAIPKSIQAFYGKSEICFSLNTLNRTEARLKSLEHIQKYLLDFEQKKALPKPVIPMPVLPEVRSLSDQPESKLASHSFSSIFQKYLFERKPLKIFCMYHLNSYFKNEKHCYEKKESFHKKG